MKTRTNMKKYAFLLVLLFVGVTAGYGQYAGYLLFISPETG